MIFSNRARAILVVFVFALLGYSYLTRNERVTSTSAGVMEAPMQVEIAALSDEMGSLEIKIDGSLYQVRNNGAGRFTIASVHPDTAVKILFVSIRPGSSTYYLPYELGRQISALDLLGTGVSTVTVQFVKNRKRVQCSVAVAVESKVSSLGPLGTCS